LLYKMALRRGFLPESFGCPCQYHSTNSPYPLFRLSPMLYILSNWQGH
jgi:hypothetical protein